MRLIVAVLLLLTVSVTVLLVWRDRYARVVAMRRLLREAAEFARKRLAETAKTTQDVAEQGWDYLRLVSFTDQALDYATISDLRNFREVSEKKAKDRKLPFNGAVAVAEYLERAAPRLRLDQIDPRFHMPDNFQQYVDHAAWPVKDA